MSVKILIGPGEPNVCWLELIDDLAQRRLCVHSRKNGSAGETLNWVSPLKVKDWASLV